MAPDQRKELETPRRSAMIPRRNLMSTWTELETKLYECLLEIEAMPASENLTEASIHVSKALDNINKYITNE